MKNKLHTTMENKWKNMINNEVGRVMFSSGRKRDLSQSDERLIYYSAFDHADVSYTYSNEVCVEAYKIVDWLLADGWKLHRKHTYLNRNGNPRDNYQIWLHEDGFLMTLCYDFPAVAKKNGSTMVIRDYVENNVNDLRFQYRPGDGNLLDSFELFYPAALTEDPEMQAYIQKFTSFCMDNRYEEPVTAKIGIISHDGGDFYVKKFSLDGHVPDFIHVDEHYGEGFTTFHDSMLARIKEESKGLVLFHGDPGTGKTQYIRMLLDMLTRSGKSILYAPPSLSAQLTEPQMIEFISDWVMDEENDCILLIEDAEPLLEIRNGADGRSTGISNLLNMTDGILNDMLGLMVICTFNTSISKIDSALLRPQRLIARKEFSKLSFAQGESLAAALGISNPLDLTQYPASLAEFYASKKESRVLVHSVKEEKKIGFGAK